MHGFSPADVDAVCEEARLLSFTRIALTAAPRIAAEAASCAAAVGGGVGGGGVGGTERARGGPRGGRPDACAWRAAARGDRPRQALPAPRPARLPLASLDCAGVEHARARSEWRGLALHPLRQVARQAGRGRRPNARPSRCRSSHAFGGRH